uniref:Uncharacterized protein n=1 Tax=Panagrolaimus davidi TaxID=227884 RepID=A0A914QN56_9BILA
MTKFDDTWFSAINLTEFNLIDVTFTKTNIESWELFASGIEKLKFLSKFEIGGNFDELPDIVFKKLPVSLHVLILHQLKDISEYITELTNLRRLALIGNVTLYNIPWNYLPKSLKELELIGTGIIEIPHGISNLINLESFTFIEVFPKIPSYKYRETKSAFISWDSINTNIKMLHVSNAENYIDFKYCNFPMLEELKLIEEYRHFCYWDELDLSRNQICTITINETAADCVKNGGINLNIAGNKIEELPYGFEKLPISELNVGGNLLSFGKPLEIGKHFWKRLPENLRKLNISGVFVYELPCLLQNLSSQQTKTIDLTFKQIDLWGEVCDCCARCGIHTNEDFVEQLLTMDYELFQEEYPKNEEIICNYWPAKTWKTMVKTRFCIDCIEKYKKDAKELQFIRKRRGSDEKEVVDDDEVHNVETEQNPIGTIYTQPHQPCSSRRKFKKAQRRLQVISDPNDVDAYYPQQQQHYNQEAVDIMPSVTKTLCDNIQNDVIFPSSYQYEVSPQHCNGSPYVEPQNLRPIQLQPLSIIIPKTTLLEILNNKPLFYAAGKFDGWIEMNYELEGIMDKEFEIIRSHMDTFKL